MRFFNKNQKNIFVLLTKSKSSYIINTKKNINVNINLSNGG